MGHDAKTFERNPRAEGFSAPRTAELKGREPIVQMARSTLDKLGYDTPLRHTEARALAAPGFIQNLPESRTHRAIGLLSYLSRIVAIGTASVLAAGYLAFYTNLIPSVTGVGTILGIKSLLVVNLTLAAINMLAWPVVIAGFSAALLFALWLMIRQYGDSQDQYAN